MERERREITGWKSIGAHFGRDRSTVIRWAQDRGLPVRYLPGGDGKKTVYALTDELDAWAAGGAAPAPGISAAPVEPQPSRWRARLAIVVILLLAIATAVWIALPPRGAPEMPADPATEALYLQGRDHWAQRDAASLTRAIDELERVTVADPGFAPAFSALADAYLLAREFGSVPDQVAFERARRAARRAQGIDPDLASAHRALGFIAYWWERDRAGAGTAFRRALALDPGDGQTRFWYGNILADNGEHATAMRELDAARLTDPGSIAIATDRAWALWSAGKTAPALAEFQSILSRNPRFVVALDCFGIVRLSEGDYAGYLDALRRRQAAQGSPALASQVATLDASFKARGVRAMQSAMIDQALSEQRAASVPDHSWAAFVASLAGDRARLLGILRLADRHREVWGSAGYTRRIEARWRQDPEIAPLLRRRAPPRIETA